MTPEYDMIVLGAGAAGLTAAGTAALLGAKTALVERHRLGGDCTWVGCVPSKTLLRASRAAHETSTANRFGLIAGEPKFEFARLMDHVRSTRQHIYEDADAPPHMEKLGVEVLPGDARFLDPHTVEIAHGSAVRRLTSRYFVIATGSRPKTADFREPPLTNETLFELAVQPKRLLVMGAGPVGTEMAQAFLRLGSEVTVVAPGDRILPRDDPDHARTLRECLAREGVRYRLGRKVSGVERTATALVARLDDGGTLDCDAVLAAIGRKPAIEGLQLEKAGVRTNENGIVTDRHCRTSRRHIFASGDVTGQFQFTHMAEHMSRVAVTNALLHWPRKTDREHVVWATFADPELATLGESEAQLRQRHARFTVFRFPFDRLDRAVTDAETTGDIKVFADGAGRILGASVLGAHAGEMIAPFALAMRNGVRLSSIANTILPYPTFALGVRRVADQFEAKRLDSPLLVVLGWLLRYRGQRRGSGALAGGR